MKICPLLWSDQDECAVHPDGEACDDRHDRCDTSAETGTAPRVPECLGPACRFCREEGVCGLQQQQDLLTDIEQRLVESDERFESLMLSIVELTERIESSLNRAAMMQSSESAPAPDSGPTPDREAANKENRDGIAHYRAGELTQARRCFQRAIALDSDFVEGHNNLGLIETETGHPETAMAHFRRAIELAPDLAASYANLGYSFYLQGSYIEAVAMYEEAVQRGENTSATWTNVGNAHFKLGNLAKARQAWGKAVALDPSNVKAAKNLVQIAQEITV